MGKCAGGGSNSSREKGREPIHGTSFCVVGIVHNEVYVNICATLYLEERSLNLDITESFVIHLREKLHVNLWRHFFMIAPPHKFLPGCRAPKSKAVLVISLCDIPSRSQPFKAQWLLCASPKTWHVVHTEYFWISRARAHTQYARCVMFPV
jgi:hypothetical protein